MIVKRGDIFSADLNPTIGSEQGGVRPVIVVQNNMGNQYSPTVIVATITSQTSKAQLPTHVFLRENICGLERPSMVQLEQIKTLDKCRLRKYIGSADEKTIGQINTAIAVSCGITTP